MQAMSQAPRKASFCHWNKLQNTLRAFANSAAASCVPYRIYDVCQIVKSVFCKLKLPLPNHVLQNLYSNGCAIYISVLKYNYNNKFFGAWCNSTPIVKAYERFLHAGGAERVKFPSRRYSPDEKRMKYFVYCAPEDLRGRFLFLRCNMLRIYVGAGYFGKTFLGYVA